MDIKCSYLISETPGVKAHFFNIASEMANKIDASHSQFLDVIPSVQYIVNLLLSHVIGNYLATAFKFIWGGPMYDLQAEIELGNGLPDIRTTAECLNALKAAGFEV